jgi:hypothetical protein
MNGNVLTQSALWAELKIKVTPAAIEQNLPILSLYLSDAAIICA